MRNDQLEPRFQSLVNVISPAVTEPKIIKENDFSCIIFKSDIPMTKEQMMKYQMDVEGKHPAGYGFYKLSDRSWKCYKSAS